MDDQKFLHFASLELSSNHMAHPPYCIVGDTVGKYVKPRFELVVTGSYIIFVILHLWIVFVDELSVSLPVKPSNTTSLNVVCSLLLSSEDDTIIKKKMITLVSRI